MVQIISPSPRAMQAGQIGQAMGIGIGKNFVDPQQLVQRGELAKAFQKFKTSSQDPNASPLDLSMNFLESIAGIPGSEKYVGQVLPLILQKAQATRAATVPSVGGQEMPSPQPQNQPQQINVQNAPQAPSQSPTTNPTSQQFLQQLQQQNPNLPSPDQDNPNLFAGTLEPTAFGMGPIPKTYSPEAIQRMQTEDLAAGFPDSPRAQRAMEYNELSRKEIQDYLQAAQAQSNIATAAAQRQAEFRKVLNEHIGSDETDLAIAESIAQRPEYRNIANDNIRAEKVKREVNLIGKQLNSFKDASNRPSPFGINRNSYDKNFDYLHDNVQPLLENGVPREVIDNMLTKNGWTTIEKEQIMNPLGKNLLSQADKLPQLPLEGWFDTAPGSKKFQQDAKKKWEDFLVKAIKPGQKDTRNLDTIKPGTSLLLLQNEFMKHNGSWQDFAEIIHNLRREGKITLDSFQQNEMNKLIERPVNHMDITEFLFGTKSR